jgi:hypothetical protein
VSFQLSANRCVEMAEAEVQALWEVERS